MPGLSMIENPPGRCYGSKNKGLLPNMNGQGLQVGARPKFHSELHQVEEKGFFSAAGANFEPVR